MGIKKRTKSQAHEALASRLSLKIMMTAKSIFKTKKNPNKINEMLTLQPRYIIFIKTVPISIPTSAAI